jgi:hypothetical protein
MRPCGAGVPLPRGVACARPRPGSDVGRPRRRPRALTDGAERDVYEDDDGRQYVLDDEGRVYGAWLPPPDVLAQEIAGYLETALEQFRAVAPGLKG